MKDNNSLNKAIVQATELAKQGFDGVVDGPELEKVAAEPSRTEFGDLACSACFQFARLLKQSPQQIASATATKIAPLLAKQKNSLLESVSAEAGYINFKFSAAYFEQALQEVLKQGKAFGTSAEGKGKRAVIDYSSPNVGKPLHVGHIRSTILGDAMKRLLFATGWKVVGSNYLCEAGTQVAMLLVGLRKYGAQGAKVEDERALVEYYVKINAEIEANEALKAEVRTVLGAMEDGDKAVARELKRVRDLSMPPLEKNYALLGVSFEESIFDSDFALPSKKIVEEAVGKGVAFKDKTGETVASLEGQGLPNLVILRSNGTTLYSTRDFGLADWRWKTHKFDKCIYVTGSDQNTHFRQVFKILSLLGRPYADRLQHVGYGLISLPEGKFSTRSGRIVLLADLLNDAIAEARNEIIERKKKTEARTGEQYSEEEVEATARAIGVGATKFAFLRVSAEKNIVFDSKRIVSFEGDTGAYVQYSLVRCQNILRKAGAKEGHLKAFKGGQLDAYEKKLLKSIAEFPLIVSNAARSLSPNTVCDYLLRLCAEFSSFYEACPVIGAESEELRQQRIAIVGATGIVLKNALQLLGIEAPERM